MCRQLNKKILFCFIVFALPIKISAKTNMKGYYITDTNDSIKVLFRVPINHSDNEPNFARLQGKVKYVDSHNRIVKLDPTHIRQMDYKQYNMLVGFLFKTHVFLQLVIDGKLKLYNVYESNHSPVKSKSEEGGNASGYSYPNGGYLIEEHNRIIFNPLNLRGREVTFKSKMAAYITSCPDLINKISLEIFKSENIEQIVKYYNTNCSQK